MASKMIRMATLLAMIVSLTFVESMPMMDSSSDGKSSRPEGQDIEMIGSPLTINKRNVVEAKNEDSMLRTIVEEDNDEKIISAAEENDDDLETAAGTNVLRPLFVYRQQLAYRERARKAGRRRSAPNFS